MTQNDSSATTMGMEEHEPILWDSSRMRTQSTEDNKNHDPDLSDADRVRSHAPDRPWCTLDVSGLLPGEPRMLSDWLKLLIYKGKRLLGANQSSSFTNLNFES